MAKFDPIVGRYVYVQCEGETYRTYYEENGQGIPMVCLHTAGTDGREWRHQLCDPEITKNFRVIAFDMPRHGKSNPPADFYKAEEEYKLTSRFYTEFILAFCRALELRKPVIMGSSMGGNVCLPLALHHEDEFSALIAIEACDHSHGWWIDPLSHPHIHGGEVCATAVFGLMAPQSPNEYRWETWWFYAQSGPGVFKGDLHFYSLDHDFRELARKIPGRVPMYLMTGVYDFACTPEMTQRTADKIKNSECIIMEDIGHFPMSENPDLFKEYLMPVLKKIVQSDRESGRSSSERGGQGGSSPSSSRDSNRDEYGRTPERGSQDKGANLDDRGSHRRSSQPGGDRGTVRVLDSGSSSGKLPRR